MSDEVIHLAASYDMNIDSAAVAEFESELAAPGLSVRTEERPKSGPFAGLEWLVPTALMVIIAKPYFDSFLSEAGKDHYHILKKAIVRLGNRFLGKNAPQTRLIYTKGKSLSDTPKYSLVFSVYGEIAPRFRIKLLVNPGAKPEDLEIAIDAFLSALASIHDESYQQGNISGFDGVNPVGGTLLVTYDPSISKLIVVNPLPMGNHHES